MPVEPIGVDPAATNRQRGGGCAAQGGDCGTLGGWPAGYAGASTNGQEGRRSREGQRRLPTRWGGYCYGGAFYALLFAGD